MLHEHITATFLWEELILLYIPRYYSKRCILSHLPFTISNLAHVIFLLTISNLTNVVF